MNFLPYINDKFQKNTLDYVIKNYDINKDNSFSPEEISELVSDAKSTFVSILSPFFMSKQKMIKNIFLALDKNPKDQNITLEEFNDYLKKDFGLELNSIKNKSIENICKQISKNSEK